MTKRLAFVLPDMRGGGAERVALTLIEDFVGRGVKIDLVLMDPTGELMPSVPTAVRVVDLRARRYRDALVPLRRYFREARPDGVQAFMWPLTVVTVMAHRLARSGARLVLSDHSTLSQHFAARPNALRALRATTRLLYPIADARVLVSAAAAADLARISGLAPSGITVIYNPISRPPDQLALASMEALWPGRGARVLSVGSLEPVKNQAMLFRAFATLARETEAQLLLLGEGSQRAALEEVARTEGIADRVRMPGYVSQPWPAYASADLFVLSSNYEGFSNVLVEAMRMGTPVVSTDCPSGPREVLDGGRYGTLVPVNDAEALARAMHHALRARHDPDALRARAEAISGQETADRYFELMGGEDPRPTR